MSPGIVFNENKPESDRNNRSTILKIINSFPGIRYRDILRITNLNNGTLSHHLSILEKSSIIKNGRTEKSNNKIYKKSYTPTDENLIINYLKIKKNKSIIMILI
jgi:predicted transcriptional regulator